MTSSINRRKKQYKTPSPANLSIPSKERSCEMCRRRKVRCSEARPACAQCLKSAAQKGIPASEVRCEYSSRSIFFLAHGGDGTAPEGGDSAGADAVISGDKTKGKEGDKMDEMDDGTSSPSTPCASPFDTLSAPSTAGTSPPGSPVSPRSHWSKHEEQLGDGVAKSVDNDSDEDGELFEARPILPSSLLRAPPSTPSAATFAEARRQPPLQAFGQQPLHRTPSSLPTPTQSRPFIALQPPPRSYTGIINRTPLLSPPLRSDGTFSARPAMAMGGGFWDGGALSRDEVMKWDSLRMNVWKSSWRGAGF